jgi:hypothetical protein
MARMLVPLLLAALPLLAAAEEEEEVEFPKWLVGSVTLGLITFLVIFSVIWETATDALKEGVDEQLMPIVRGLFGELTLMGFLGLTMFIIGKTDLLTSLSKTIYVGGESDQFGEQFETVHMVIFMVMVIFFIQIVLVILGGDRLTKFLGQIQETIVEADDNYTKALEQKRRKFKEIATQGTLGGAPAPAADKAAAPEALRALDDELDGEIEDPISAHEDPSHPFVKADPEVAAAVNEIEHSMPATQPNMMVNKIGAVFLKANSSSGNTGWEPQCFPCNILPSPALVCSSDETQLDEVLNGNAKISSMCCAASKTRQAYEFAAIRQRFVSRPTSEFEDPDLDASDTKEVISKEFDFADYLTARFAWVGAEIVEVTARSWMLLWFIIVIGWSCTFTHGSNVDTWLYIAMFYFMCLTAIPIVNRMYWLYSMVIPMYAPVEHTHHHTAFCCLTYRQLRRGGVSTYASIESGEHKGHGHGHSHEHEHEHHGHEHGHEEEEEEEGGSCPQKCVTQCFCFFFACPVGGGPFQECRGPFEKPCKFLGCIKNLEEEEEEEEEGPSPYLSLFVGGHKGAHGLLVVTRCWMLLTSVYVSTLITTCVTDDYHSMWVKGEQGGKYMFIAQMTVAFAPVPLFFAVIFRMIFLLSLTLSIEHFRTNDKEEGGCVDQIKRVEIALLTEKTITMIRTIQRLTMSIDDSVDKDAPAPPPAGPKSAATLRAEKQLKKQIRILFDQVDVDGSGEISADELKTIFFKLNYAGSDDPDCSGIARKVILAVDDGEGGDVDPEISFDELFNYLVAVRRVRVRIAIVSLLCCAGLCAVLTVRSRTPLSLSPLLSLSLSLSFAADGAIAPEHVGDGR